MFKKRKLFPLRFFGFSSASNDEDEDEDEVKKNE